MIKIPEEQTEDELKWSHFLSIAWFIIGLVFGFILGKWVFI